MRFFFYAVEVSIGTMSDKKVKKILIFSLAYYPHVGGAEVAIKEITDRIQDIEFHMVTLNFSEEKREEKIGNVFVHRIGSGNGKWNKYWYQFFAAWEARSLHRKYHFDGIWAMMAHSCGIPAGIFKTLHPEVPYLLTLQEGDPLEHIERLARPVWPLFKRGFTKADMVVAESTFLGRWARRMGFTGPLEVIPNGVDAERFARVQHRVLNTNMVMLVTTSRLVNKNAVDDVIRALTLLPEHVTFTICGTGPDEMMLKTLVKNIGVETRVKFMGYVEQTRLPVLFNECDIFIRPSRSEGMGNSFIEAMAAELPVIATQEGGIADFLFDAK